MKKSPTCFDIYTATSKQVGFSFSNCVAFSECLNFNTPPFLFDLFCWEGFSYLHNRKICKFAKLDTELLKSHPNERSALMVVWSLSSLIYCWKPAEYLVWLRTLQNTRYLTRFSGNFDVFCQLQGQANIFNPFY